MDANKDRFPLLRKVLKAIGLPAEAVDDIIERILDWLSTKDEPASGPAILPFKLRDDFLSAAENSFYQVLRTAVGEQALICPKVNLGDLFYVSTGDHRKNRALANRVDRKHVDFLLCDPKTVLPVLGIELDDKSHERPDRKTRDELVDSVFAAAGLPLVRIPVRMRYSVKDVAELVRPHLGAALVQPFASPKPTLAPSKSDDSSPHCPKCGSTMLLRTAKSGSNAGGQFWGCPNFPRCRSMVPVRPAS